MQGRTILASLGVVGVGALAVTQMGIGADDRKYKKTLAYMHDGRDKFEKKLNKYSKDVETAVNGKK